MTTARDALLVRVAAAVPDPVALGRPVRLGVDGIDGSGKTTFADELATVLRSAGREVVRVSVDDFHRPTAERYARGVASPEGAFHDSYDDARFRTDVLDPFGPGGSRAYRAAGYDRATDARWHAPVRHAGEHAVLLVDGIYLHRDELVDAWDLSVYLRVPVPVAVARMAVRDAFVPDPADPRHQRFLAGQRLYHATCDPQRRATLVVDNADLAAPVLVTGHDPTTA